MTPVIPRATLKRLGIIKRPKKKHIKRGQSDDERAARHKVACEERQLRLFAIANILDAVDQRAMTVDGPLEFEDFRRELRKEEARAIYVLAAGAPKRELARYLKQYK